MRVPDMDISTWIKPARSWGHIKMIGMSSEENSVDGIYQSLSVLTQAPDRTRWDYDCPYTGTKLKPDQMSDLIALANRISVPMYKTERIRMEDPIG